MAALAVFTGEATLGLTEPALIPKCSTCGRTTFGSRASYSQHRRYCRGQSTTSPRPIEQKCDHCGLADFKTVFAYKKHISRCTWGRPCALGCGRRIFHSGDSRAKHERDCTGEPWTADREQRAENISRGMRAQRARAASDPKPLTEALAELIQATRAKKPTRSILDHPAHVKALPDGTRPFGSRSGL